MRRYSLIEFDCFFLIYKDYVNLKMGMGEYSWCFKWWKYKFGSLVFLFWWILFKLMFGVGGMDFILRECII